MEDENQLNEEQMPEEGAEEESEEGEDEKKDDQEYEEEGVEEEDLISVKDRFGGIPMMKLPKEHMILQSYEVYLPSIQTENLLSEQNRKLFAEAFMMEETKEAQQIPRLADLCFSIFLKSYTGGNVDARIQGELRIHFGEALDINFPLKDITDLDIDSYWKKVFLMKCQDKLLAYQKSRNSNEDWKSLGIQEKFRELLETSSFEEWNDFEMRQLAKNIAPYIHELKILQLIPLEEYSIEKDPNLTNYKIYNYPPEDCHHINLELLGELTNLTSLHIEFQPPKIGYKYDSRFFKFSYWDVENLATALLKLQTLKEFKLRRSQMDNRKLQILRKALASLEHLELLDLSYNELKNDTGWTLATLLVETKSIKSLKLDGNFLGALGICSLFYGIQNYGGHLEYVSLARNLVGQNGVLCIGRALSNSYQVDHLNLNGIKVTEYGAELIASFVKLQETALTTLEICAIPLGAPGGNRLIKSLYKNRNILKLECRACNLTDKQEYRIKLLLMRNNYLKKIPYDNSEIRNTSEERQKLATDIDNWLSTTKHPILLNVFETLEQQQDCMETVSTRNVFVRNIPKFIPKAACLQKTNKELLFGEYYETNVEDLRVTMDLRRYLSQGVSHQFLAWSYKVGKSTVREIILETCDVLWECLHPVYVSQTNVTDYQEITSNFCEKWNMPNCIGAIDGKHISIQRPANSGSCFYNYKSHFSIVLLAACDANYCLTAVDVGAYGSQSDGGILAYSEFGKQLLGNKLPLPVPSRLPNSTIVFPYYFIGIPTKTTNHEAISSQSLTRNKRIFNYRLSRARMAFLSFAGECSVHRLLVSQTQFYKNERVNTYILSAELC